MPFKVDVAHLPDVSRLKTTTIAHKACHSIMSGPEVDVQVLSNDKYCTQTSPYLRHTATSQFLRTSIRYALCQNMHRGLGHAILGKISTGHLVTELTEI